MQWRGDWSDQKARKIGEIVSKQKNQWNYLFIYEFIAFMYSSWIIIENVNNEITNVIKIVMFLPAASFVGFLLDQRKLVGRGRLRKRDLT